MKSIFVMNNIGGKALTVDQPNVSNLPEFTDGRITKLIEFDFLGENIEWYVDRPPQSATTLVIIKDGIETRPIAIEEIFVSQWIEIANPSSWITQKRFRKLVQSAQLGFES